jgi:ppGpp synthetase/RelA/SpoT-type nucleotidyltranferase
MTAPAPADEAVVVDQILCRYMEEREKIALFLPSLQALAESSALAPYVHSTKVRVKDIGHLKEKLFRKFEQGRQKRVPFEISVDTLFTRITDLIGLRILHLHTRQMEQIHQILPTLLVEYGYTILETFARTWDDESRSFFKSIDIECQNSGENMYTSVHYVIDLRAPSPRRGEIQVRTLSEELWGEVDHSINYPRRTPSLACREQLRVLARATSTCTRLVDSILLSHADALAHEKAEA